MLNFAIETARDAGQLLLSWVVDPVG